MRIASQGAVSCQFRPAVPKELTSPLGGNEHRESGGRFISEIGPVAVENQAVPGRIGDGDGDAIAVG